MAKKQDFKVTRRYNVRLVVSTLTDQGEADLNDQYFNIAEAVTHQADAGDLDGTLYGFKHQTHLTGYEGYLYTEDKFACEPGEPDYVIEYSVDETASVPCDHQIWQAGRCAEMACYNYVGRHQ